MQDNYVRNLEQESRHFVKAIDAHPLLGRVARGAADHGEYVQFLVATYQYVRFSGELLANTAEGLRRSGRCETLLAAIDRKADEEAPHDRWALQDLAELGVDCDLVRAATPPHAVLGYVHSSRAWAERGSPAFLGAAFLLECASMQRARVAADKLIRARRIANIERAVSFLALHGDADIGHVAELTEQLRGIERSEDQKAIMWAAALLHGLYPLFFVPGAVFAPPGRARDAT
jgi:hypothetical protein